ncbi:MAG: hypothetical protein H0X34_10595 [Chthoniobacterales bacterium]|nr:hypothetical protein [Chthoniobacterales bacterium]
MKKKQPLSLPPGVMKPTPEDFPRPDPMDLAKLAAMLLPDQAPKVGLELAMRFYFEAVCLSRELPTGFDDLLTAFGSTERKDSRLMREAGEIMRDRWEVNALKFEPHTDSDDARRYLDGQCRLLGVLKKRVSLRWSAETFFKKLRGCYKLNSMPVAQGSAQYHLTARKFIASLSRAGDDGRVYYLIPCRWLAWLAEYEKRCVSKQRKKSWRKRRPEVVNRIFEKSSSGSVAE